MPNLTSKEVLITGAHGFLGHHVVAQLVSTSPKYNILTPTRKELDLMDGHKVAEYLSFHKPDVIIHLAAQCGGIGINRQKPGEFLYNNLMMTTHLIDQCVETVPRCKFVGIGTVCSYPKHTPIPFKEDDLYNGYPEETNAPYGIAKRVQLEMLKAYRAQYGFNGIFLIPVNMVGEFDNFNSCSSHVIPAMMKKFHWAKENGDHSVLLWGDGSASREFLYAGDCARAIVMAAESYNESEPVNIGTGQEITIAELASKVQSVVGFDGKIIWDTSKPNGQPRRCLDVTRAKQKFDFEAEHSLDEVLKRTYEWAQRNNVL